LVQRDRRACSGQDLSSLQNFNSTMEMITENFAIKTGDLGRLCSGYQPRPLRLHMGHARHARESTHHQLYLDKKRREETQDVVQNKKKRDRAAVIIPRITRNIVLISPFDEIVELEANRLCAQGHCFPLIIRRTQRLIVPSLWHGIFRCEGVSPMADWFRPQRHCNS